MQFLILCPSLPSTSLFLLTPSHSVSLSSCHYSTTRVAYLCDITKSLTLFDSSHTPPQFLPFPSPLPSPFALPPLVHIHVLSYYCLIQSYDAAGERYFWFLRSACGAYTGEARRGQSYDTATADTTDTVQHKAVTRTLLQNKMIVSPLKLSTGGYDNSTFRTILHEMSPEKWKMLIIFYFLCTFPEWFCERETIILFCGRNIAIWFFTSIFLHHFSSIFHYLLPTSPLLLPWALSLLHLYYRRCFNPDLFTASNTWYSLIKRDLRTFS